MTLDKALKIFNTVRYLKLSQIFYRIYYRFKKPTYFIKSRYLLESNEMVWDGPWTHLPTIIKENTFNFLSVEGSLQAREDWNDPKFEKLWLYNLHYFDDLNSRDNASKDLYYKTLIKKWIDENPTGLGNGWEPYPLSLRIVNWVKWMSRQDVVDPMWIRSLNTQTECLLSQIEYHILGNHLFANAKALIFAGVFLKGDLAKKSLSHGLKILDHELPEQFLHDGAHFELSPMYHSILLWDLLELINLCNLSKNPELVERKLILAEVAEKALSWLQNMIHPDQEISFFNDAAFGIAPAPERIFNYAATLGLKNKKNSNILTTMDESGYSRIAQSTHVMIIDHANVGPDYLPGHAHADTLSFEWSVGNSRVLVNGGTSIYGTSGERHRQRKTLSHNTLEIDNQDSSEVWGGFRVARRAKATLKHTSQDNDKVILRAQHDGYKRLSGKVIHSRQYISELNSIQISDELTGEFTSAVAYYHIHPDLKVEKIDDKVAMLSLPDGQKIRVRARNEILIEDSTWHPFFGISEKNKQIKIQFSDQNQNVTFEILSESL